MAKWYENLATIGAGAAAGYAGASGAAAGKLAGSLLNRKKRKGTVSDTPSTGWENEASDMPSTPNWEDEDEDIY